MIVIGVIGFLASLSLKKMLQQKGYLESRIWLKPMRVAVLFILILTGLSYSPLATLLNSVPGPLSFFINLLCIACYCSLLSKIVKTVKALPNKVDAPQGSAQ